MSNPLIAQPKSSTTAVSGVPILEDATSVAGAISSGDWASAVLGAAGTAMDALAFVADPFGSILAAGVGWLMEHVGPLKDALDKLAGNPDVIKAHSDTWQNISDELGKIADDLNTAVKTDLADWKGPAADSYRQQAGNIGSLLGAAQQATSGTSKGVKTAGEVVAAVRQLVRDIISQVVGHMISWALQVIATLGIGLAWVVPQVVETVASTAMKITSLVGKLTKALGQLAKLLGKAGGVFKDASKALKNINPGKVTTKPPTRDLPSGAKNTNPLTGKNNTPSTTPSSAKPDTPPASKPNDTPNDTTKPSSSDTPPNSPPASTQPKPDNTPNDTTKPSSATDTPKSPSNEKTPSSDSNTHGGDSATPSKSDDTTTSSSTSEKGGSSGSESSGEPGNARDTGVEANKRFCEGDPVDVVTGEVVMVQTGLAFPGPLELVFERTHVSSYRVGRLFSPSWASTLDQRLEIDDENARYFSPDGMILVYPLPVVGRPELPVEGPRWPLSVDPDGGYTLENPVKGHSLRFGILNGRSTQIPRLLSISDEDGTRVDFEYDALGMPSTVRHSEGYVVGIHTENNRVTRLDAVDARTGQAVQVASYGYDDQGRLASVVNSSGKPMLFTYDIDGRLTGWQDRNDAWYRYVYDLEGRCVKTVGDRGFLDGTFSYDRENRITTYTDSLGNTNSFEFDENSQVVREVDRLGAATTFVWDRYDRLLSRTDPLGQTTSYVYDEHGRLYSVTRPDGSSVRVVRDEDWMTITVTADDGRSWSRTYEGNAVPDPFADQLGVSTEPGYQEIARQSAGSPATSPSSNPEELTASPSPAALGQDRDLFGRVRSVTTVGGGRIRLGWTVEGLPASRVLPSGAEERWRYDPEGNEIERAGGAGQVNRAEYGPFGLRTAEISPTGGRTVYEYDTELRLAAVTNPRGLRWTYRYDPMGRLVEETDFDGRVLRFSYDAAGRLVQTVNGLGEPTTYGYDVLGNMVERRTTSGVTQYAYDPVGRLIRAVSADAVLELERDEQGRVTAETVNGRRTSYSYAEGNTGLRRRTPSGADSVWTYNAAGTPLTLTIAGHTVRFDHDAAGRETQRNVDGTVTLTQSYDPADQLVTQSVVAGSGPRAQTRQQRQFRYGPDGRLRGVTDALSGPVRLALDPAGRITEVSAADRIEGYRYDPAGAIVETSERHQVPRGPQAETGPRQYVRNTLVSAGSVAYTYDAQGRTVSRRVGNLLWQFGWDSQDRLVSVATPDCQQWRYRYDPIGRRIAKERLAPDGVGVAERFDFTWSGALVVEQVHTDPSGVRRTVTWDYHPGQNRPVVQIEHGVSELDRRFFAIVTDLVGSPAELVDAGGNVVWHNVSTLWGRPVAPGAAIPLRFPGQYADAETGLHYNVFRYYDPGVGRYLSQDPLGLAPADDPIAYVTNPLREYDPLGLVSPCQMPQDSGRGGGGGKKGRTGGARDANHVSDTTPSGAGKASEHPLGSHDGVNVKVDSHQNKHHNPPVFKDKLEPHKAQKGAKFPSHVGDKWHENYFGPKAAEISKQEYNSMKDKSASLKDTLDNRPQAVKDAQAKADLAEAKANNAKHWAQHGNPENKQFAQAHAKQLDNEARAARNEANDLNKPWANDQARYDSLQPKLNGQQAFSPSKNEVEGVKYDITARYDPKTGNIDATYHNNPNPSKAQEKAEKNQGDWWWNAYGKEIARENPHLNLPTK